MYLTKTQIWANGVKYPVDSILPDKLPKVDYQELLAKRRIVKINVPEPKPEPKSKTPKVEVKEKIAPKKTTTRRKTTTTNKE